MLKLLVPFVLYSIYINRIILQILKEIDIILEFTTNKEYHEIKSGKNFTISDDEINKCLIKIFRIYKLVLDEKTNKYFIIINSGYGINITTYSSDIVRFKNNKNKTSKFKKFCKEIGIIEDKERSQFHNFIKALTFESGIG